MAPSIRDQHRRVIYINLFSQTLHTFLAGTQIAQSFAKALCPAFISTISHPREKSNSTMCDALKKGALKIKGQLKERLIYHDPCYLSRGVGITEQRRTILRACRVSSCGV
ncbi:MAG TPA: hypothetical protein DCP92_20665 [Nitrospiraceae bacterium]|nr:hypothetical protein [Nitrospiraceae bacterium]